jgi:hypothetical protein
MLFKLREGGLEMPGFDGTGPRGAGPLTGAGRGYCIGQLAQANTIIDQTETCCKGFDWLRGRKIEKAFFISPGDNHVHQDDGS